MAGGVTEVVVRVFANCLTKPAQLEGYMSGTLRQANVRDKVSVS